MVDTPARENRESGEGNVQGFELSRVESFELDGMGFRLTEGRRPPRHININMHPMNVPTIQDNVRVIGDMRRGHRDDGIILERFDEDATRLNLELLAEL
ncbi:MAG: hypothetical protein CVU73_11750 [Deltaproteobacteria bacterium HGW-Deltaproteobacteria-8]|jgi:hypothetical protein|nr:MAG: hypothetical protein CVU73_11750 [Deltaproteobacteria bacterium HGW-Deltaproteobacteria-8]